MFISILYSESGKCQPLYANNFPDHFHRPYEWDAIRIISSRMADLGLVDNAAVTDILLKH